MHGDNLDHERSNSRTRERESERRLSMFNLTDISPSLLLLTLLRRASSYMQIIGGSQTGKANQKGLQSSIRQNVDKLFFLLIPLISHLSDDRFMKKRTSNTSKETSRQGRHGTLKRKPEPLFVFVTNGFNWFPRVS